MQRPQQRAGAVGVLHTVAGDQDRVGHGAVYGTAGGKPLVLDAHTGADKEISPGLAPVAVSWYASVAAGAQPGGPLQAYSAVD